MKKFLVVILLGLYSQNVVSQNIKLPDDNVDLKETINGINKNSNITADSFLTVLSNWSKYPIVAKKGIQYVFNYKDSILGDIPIRVYVPVNYDEKVKTPVLLLLHGAVGSSSFEDLNDNGEDLDEDIFFNYFKQLNYIIIRPKADERRKFNWVVNDFSGSLNRTFDILISAIIHLKKVLNIDDQKVTCFGHSDGADGTFGMDIYNPGMFNGFVCYNSMFNVLFARNIYFRNAINKPIYITHSDKDALRPIEQTRLVIKAFDSLQIRHTYKEYYNYQHYDKHLEIDLPNAFEFISKNLRNPFTKDVYWETDNPVYNKCNWIKIMEIDTNLSNAKWHTPIHLNSFDPRTKTIKYNSYYYRVNSSGAIKATYNNNQFSIETSRIKTFEVFLSKSMVNADKPIKVFVNGKLAYNQKVRMDKAYIATNFLNNYDRQELWFNSIKINYKENCWK